MVVDILTTSPRQILIHSGSSSAIGHAQLPLPASGTEVEATEVLAAEVLAIVLGAAAATSDTGTGTRFT